jgi:hypothetical protein
LASTSQQQHLATAIARDDFLKEFRPTFPQRGYSSRSWSIVYPDSLGFARLWFHSDKLHSQSLAHHLDYYFLLLRKKNLFINSHNYRISLQLVILPAEAKRHSKAVINFMFAIYKSSLSNLDIGEKSCCKAL